MKNHASTKRGRQIERWIYERLQARTQSAPELIIALVPFGVSENGTRNALLRLAARGQVVCALDTSVEGYPRRVWRINRSLAPPAPEPGV